FMLMCSILSEYHTILTPVPYTTLFRSEVTLRLLPAPEVARALLIGFDSIEAAGHCVADVIGAGIIPAGMELMDRPAVEAAEAFVDRKSTRLKYSNVKIS